MTMAEWEYVNPVVLSPLILAECRFRVMNDVDERRTGLALAIGLSALYNAAIRFPLEPEHAQEQLRRLAVPSAGSPSGVHWRCDDA